jgi:hypothetical protein
MGLEVSEEQPAGHKAPHAQWACLNRRGSEVACTIQWGYTDNNDNLCRCGSSPHTIEYLTICPDLDNQCATADL